MEKERERIERMLKEGKITKEQSEKLLKALEESTAAEKKKAIKKSRMKIISISIVMVSLIIIGGLFVVSQLSKKRVRLEYKVKKGDILQYKQIQTQGKIEFKTAYRLPKIVDVKRETYFTIKIKDVDNKGMAQASMTIKAVIEKENNGEKTSEFLDFSNRPILMNISKPGKTEVENWEECKAIFKELKMSSVAVQFSPILPEKKVKVGDTWTYEEEMSSLLFDLPPIDVKLENKVMGFEKIAGDDCVKILTRQKTVIPIQKGKVSIPGLTGQVKVTIKDFDLNKEFITYFAYDKGRPVRMEGTITGGEKRIYQRIKKGKERSWETDVKYEFTFILTEATAEEYEAWKEEIIRKELSKTEAWQYYRKGENYYREGQYDQAITSFKKALEEKLETPWLIAWIHVELGWAYDKKGLKKEAEKEYKYVLKFAETVEEKDKILLRAIRAAQNKLK